MNATTDNELCERGYFWWAETNVPEGQFAPSEGSQGLLTISSKGVIELDLDNALTENRASMIDLNRTIEKEICGVLKSNKQRVFLGKLRILNSVMSTNAFSHEKYGAEFCLVYHNTLPIIKEVKFIDKLEVHLLGFDDWFGLGSIAIKTTRRSTTAQHKSKKDKIYKVQDGKIIFSFNVLKPHDYKHHTDVQLKETNTLIYKKNFKTLDAAIEGYLRIQDFLIILTNRERTLEWPTLQLNREKIQATLYFRRTSLLAEEIKYYNTWIRFPTIESSFALLFDRWNEKYKKFGPGFYNYLSLRRGFMLYSEQRYMSSILGLESLHRHLCGNPPNKHLEDKVARILDKIEDKNDKKWLKRQLKFCTEPSLKDRIYGLLRSLPIRLDDALLSDFSDRCAGHRNDISHFGTGRKDTPYLDFIRELHVLSSALELLYHFIILQEIGISSQYLTQLFEHGFESYYMKQILWDAGLLENDPRKVAAEEARASMEAAMASIEAEKNAHKK
jgi:hypothetical protein